MGDGNDDLHKKNVNPSAQTPKMYKVSAVRPKLILTMSTMCLVWESLAEVEKCHVSHLGLYVATTST